MGCRKITENKIREDRNNLKNKEMTDHNLEPHILYITSYS